jgi:RimK family alpha-L-glutamate ligase
VTDLEELGRVDLPVVVKPRFGSWGLDITRCRDRAELERCAAEIGERTWFRRHGALVQELLPQRELDLRVLVAAGTVVGGAERVAASGEWRTNVSLGGSHRPAEPPPEARELARAAAAATGCELVGVDLFRGHSGSWLVLELNGAAEFDAVYSLGGRNVYGDLADALGLGGSAQRMGQAISVRYSAGSSVSPGLTR